MSELGFLVEDGIGGFGSLLQENDDLILAGSRIVSEDFDGTAGAMTGTNTIFDLFNSPGTSEIVGLGGFGDQTVPVVGDKIGRFYGDTRVVKRLAGLSFSGPTDLFCSGYVKLKGGLLAGPTTSRLMVVEESVAAGGDDIATFRCHGDFGDLSLGDGVTFSGTKSTRRLDADTWTRFDWWVSQLSDYQEMRLFHGRNLHAPWWDPDETLTYTVTSNDIMDAWGLGLFLGNAAGSNGFDFAGVWLGTGIYRGPVDGARGVVGAFVKSRLEIPTIGAAV